MISKKQGVLFILFLGIFFRLHGYLSNRPLWSDEANTANKLISFPIYELIQPRGSSYSKMHSYPIGFLAIEKFILKVFPNNELSLRLFPFLCSIFSLFLFERLIRKVFNLKWGMLALAIFAFSPYLIYYSSELKPYSSDIMISLILFLAFFRMIEESSNHRYMLFLGILGAVVLHFSFPAVYILGGVALIFILNATIHKEWEKVFNMLVSATLWFIAFIWYYFISLRHFLRDQSLSTNWSKSFIPFHDGIVAIGRWIGLTFHTIFSKSLHLPGYFALILFLIGVFYMGWKKKDQFFILFPPVVFVVFLSGFKLYPVAPRTTLFLVPILILFFVKGVEFLCETKFLKGFKSVHLIVIGFVLSPLLVGSVESVITPQKKEEIRPLMIYLKTHQQKGDAIYLNSEAQYAYGYYQGYYQFDERIEPVWIFSDKILEDKKGQYIFRIYAFYAFSPNGVVLGMKERGELEKVYESSRGMLGGNKRTWVLFSHAKENYRKNIITMLDKQGKQLKQLSQPGAYLYLYDFNV